MARAGRLFDIELLEHELSQASAGLRLHYLNSCVSTNVECQQLARHGTVVISEQQTGGRGRRGRDWHSPRGRNLYCSIGVEKQLSAASLGLIPLLVGCTMIEALLEHNEFELGLKWPNDILSAGSKVGGILIENQVRACDRFFLTVGIGLNLKLDHKDLQAIGQPATGLYAKLPESNHLSRLVSILIQRVFREVDDFDGGSHSEVVDRFTRYDALSGRSVKVVSAGDEYHGTYAGIAPDGRLRVLTEQGEQCFVAADVSLRPYSDATAGLR